MPRIKYKNHYWDEELLANKIEEYNNASDDNHKNHIYETYLYQPIKDLAVAVLNTSARGCRSISHDSRSQTEAVDSCVSHITMQLERYTKSKGKSYSYFNMIGRNCYLQLEYKEQYISKYEAISIDSFRQDGNDNRVTADDYICNHIDQSKEPSISIADEDSTYLTMWRDWYVEHADTIIYHAFFSQKQREKMKRALLLVIDHGYRIKNNEKENIPWVSSKGAKYQYRQDIGLTWLSFQNCGVLTNLVRLVSSKLRMEYEEYGHFDNINSVCLYNMISKVRRKNPRYVMEKNKKRKCKKNWTSVKWLNMYTT